MFSSIKPRTRPRLKRLDDPAFAYQLPPRKGEKVRKATCNPLIGDEEHKTWLLSIGSVISGAPAETCHHLLRTPTNEKGMGSKSSEGWLLPLTHREHDDLHLCGNEPAYLIGHDIHGPSLAALLRQISGAPVEVAQRAIRQHKEAIARTPSSASETHPDDGSTGAETNETHEASGRISAPTMKVPS